MLVTKKAAIPSGQGVSSIKPTLQCTTLILQRVWFLVNSETKIWDIIFLNHSSFKQERIKTTRNVTLSSMVINSSRGHEAENY